ncbi:uncharacterized protein BDZ99DRAFT_3852 [Mytilinidion resinicola]|uniref:Uncharacterized protein n=1 Tax=Mytilinidion resinicola TaxID=574789 RepID=A0A6A6Z9J6_9PEZI|nr:uncharacterized protein BDZ99DRAFT_3852 [Mytilinidion resinicola]KAF2816887.1 hypothetical protein BDZ99DRAFT_3852 [Mytilinidion resinicola]
MRDPHNTRVSFGVVSTPITSLTFVRVLGFEMNLYKTALGDNDHVFITKHAPNLSGLPALPKLGQYGASASPIVTTAHADFETAEPVPDNSENPKVVFTARMGAASLNDIKSKVIIKELTAHIDIISADHRSLLTGGALV